MDILNPDVSIAGFFRSFTPQKNRLLMLDYDGTLSPFVEDRDKAVPYPGVRERLDRLLDDPYTDVVIVTGREVDVVRRLLELPDPPEIWGCHGAQRFAPGKGVTLELTPDVKTAIEEVRSWLVKADLLRYAEFKPTGCAVHWRGLDEGETTRIRETVDAFRAALSDDYPLKVHGFDGGLEFRTRGFDKGGAVRTVLARIDDGTPVAYLGDDRTDEDAFAALGGRGLKLLVRTEPRDTKADIRIVPPEELLEFLDAWIVASSK